MPRLRGLKPESFPSCLLRVNPPYTHAPFEGIETSNPNALARDLGFTPYTHAPFEGIETNVIG